MSGCLDDRALVLIAVGEAAADDRSHVGACPSCGNRLRELERDLRQIDETLRGTPPRTVTARRPLVPRAWLVVPAAALAGALAVLGVLRPADREAVQVATVPRSAEETSQLTSYATEVSAALFDTGVEANVAPMPLRRRAGRGPVAPAAASDLAAALGDGTPCTARRLFGASCNDYTSALFF
jgi:hypothetical protein